MNLRPTWVALSSSIDSLPLPSWAATALIFRLWSYCQSHPEHQRQHLNLLADLPRFSLQALLRSSA